MSKKVYNLTRGLPSPEQIEITSGLHEIPVPKNLMNYGGLDGIPEIRKWASKWLVGLPDDQIIACGNSSLALMGYMAS